MIERFKPGMVFSEELALTPELVEGFAQFSGDRNPVHLAADAAREYGFSRPFAHGAILTAVVSRLIGMRVPGPGAVWMNQHMDWLKPVFVGDSVKVEAEIESVSTGAETLMLQLRAANQNGEAVMRGSAQVKLAPKLAEKAPKQAEKETRTALVTGGSRGIGAAIARSLAAAGCNVAITYHSNRSAADEVLRDLAQCGVVGQAYQADLLKEGSGADIASRAEHDLGRIDIVAHAATQPLPVCEALETQPALMRDFHRIHVESALELARAAAPGMIKRGFGRLVFLGTSALFGSPPPKMAAYLAAKHSLWGLVRCLAAELGPHQVTANMVSPGLTVTDLTSSIPPRMKEAEARRVPVRRLAMPEDVADAVAFLSSEHSGYINGQNIPVSGGPV